LREWDFFLKTTVDAHQQLAAQLTTWWHQNGSDCHVSFLDDNLVLQPLPQLTHD